LVAGVVNDSARLAYIRDHIAATHAALVQGVPVGAYFAWSLLDNFEWASGYAKRFGLVHVDFETQKRTLKNSALWYQQFLSENFPWQPLNSKGSPNTLVTRWSFPGLDLSGSRRRIHGVCGPIGLRQVHHAAHDRRPGTHDQGPRLPSAVKNVSAKGPSERGAAMVFQSYALYPHMTVEENMGFGLRMSGTSKSGHGQAGARNGRAAATDPFAQALPQTTVWRTTATGGHWPRHRAQAQGVSCLTSPCPTWTLRLRVQMRIELAKLHADLQTTMVYVTHDQTEAMTLGQSHCGVQPRAH
jgi:hypothetical protein